jgi:AcrR family transcriptional regulator
MGGARGRSRDAVFQAAATLFADKGYTNTSIREIAQRASVDPAIVMRHFGSKERLFVESMALDTADHLSFDPPLDDLGERIVRAVVATDNRLRSTYLGLVRASDTGEVGSVLRQMHEQQFVQPLLALMHGDDREVRARLAASMVGGLMYSLWTVEDDGLLTADPDAVVALYAPALQALLAP